MFLGLSLMTLPVAIKWQAVFSEVCMFLLTLSVMPVHKQGSKQNKAVGFCHVAAEMLLAK